MRPFTSIAAALTVSLCLVATLPAQTVSTVPVGFNTVTVAAAANTTTPTSTVVSAPFYQIATFQGAISSVDSSNQLSFTGANFGNLTATPFLARFKTGNSTGRFYVITGNTATQLTLDTSAADSTPDIAGYPMTTGAPTTSQTQVAVGDSVEVLPANTLGTLFGTSTVPFQTGASANAADNVLLFNGTSWDVYFHNGTSWRRSGSLANQNNAIVLPDRGMFIVRRATSSMPLTFLGTVPSTTEKTDFPGPGSSFRANRFPVDMALKGVGNTFLNLQSLPGWQSGASASAADNVYIWNGTSWFVYFYNGTNWRRSGSLANQDTTVVPLGGAMFIVRQSSAAGSNSTLSQVLPYTL